jgi:hypothetical protein
LRPRGAGARAGLGEDQLAAPVRGQDEICLAQCHGFLWAQRGVVQAAEECGQLRAEAGHLGQDRPHLGGTGNGLRVDRGCGPRCCPLHLAERVGREQAELDGIAQGVMEHRPLAGDGGRRSAAAVQAHRQRVHRSADESRVAELRDGQ